jgi:hypothetical protein
MNSNHGSFPWIRAHASHELLPVAILRAFVEGRRGIGMT